MPAVEETKEEMEVVLTTLVVALKSDVSTLDQNLLEFARKFFASRFSYSHPGAKMAIEVLDDSLKECHGVKTFDEKLPSGTGG